jgi:DNA-binding transcriptional MerR regulator
MMTKLQAAEYLGCSVRSIEAYTFKGKLNPARSKGTRGDINLYDETELDELKSERAKITYLENIKPATVEKSNPLESITKNEDARQFLITAIQEALTNVHAESLHELKQKTFLTLSEAEKVSGLKSKTLLRLIKSKKLRAKKIANAWRITPEDLQKLSETKL